MCVASDYRSHCAFLGGACLTGNKRIGSGGASMRCRAAGRAPNPPWAQLAGPELRAVEAPRPQGREAGAAEDE